MALLRTKFMTEEDSKVKKRLEPFKVIVDVTIRCSTYDFLFDFNRNYARKLGTFFVSLEP